MNTIDGLLCAAVFTVDLSPFLSSFHRVIIVEEVTTSKRYVLFSISASKSNPKALFFSFFFLEVCVSWHLFLFTVKGVWLPLNTCPSHLVLFSLKEATVTTLALVPLKGSSVSLGR